MKKTYFIIPSSDIWNEKAIVEVMRKAYEMKDAAIEVAKELSRKYDSDFFVCAIEVKVSTIPHIVDLL